MIVRNPTLWVVLSGGIMVLFYQRKSRYEERFLIERHGDAYRDYRRRARGVLLID